MWTAAKAYCRDLRLDGHSDWRLPDIEELAAIYIPNNGGPIWSSVPIQGSFGWFWSGTPEPGSPVNGWFFALGGRVRGFKAHNNYENATICVRGAPSRQVEAPAPPPSPPAPQPSSAGAPVEGKHFWIDDASQLMWTTQDNGKAITGNEAVRYCRNLKLEGDTDWRLASAPELIALKDVVSQDDSPFHLDIPFVWTGSSGSTPGTTWVVNVEAGEKVPRFPSAAMASALCARRVGPLDVKQVQAKNSVPAPPAPKEKTYQDRGEYDLCRSLVGTFDPAALVPLLSTWQEQYPDSSMAADRMYYFAVTFSQFPIPAPAAPDKFEVLQRVAQPQIGIRPGAGSLPRSAPNFDQVAIAARLVISNIDHAFSRSPKTAGVSDAEWAKAKSYELAIAHKTLGWVAASRNDRATAKREYQLSLQADAEQPELSAMLAAIP